MSALFAAMAAAFPEIEGALKDRNNPAFKSKYADLSSVVDAVKPALAKHKLFFVQLTHEQAGGVCIETVVGHADGDKFSFGKLFVPAAKQDAQGYGSALTYARRYSLMTAFGVCPEDDDGNAAVKTAPRQNETGEVISKDQLAQLQAEVNRTGTDAAVMCKHYKIECLPDMRASQFEGAIKVLKAKPDAQAMQEAA